MTVITLTHPATYYSLSPAQVMPLIAGHVLDLQGWKHDDQEARALVLAALRLFAGHLSSRLATTAQSYGPASAVVRLQTEIQRAAQDGFPVPPPRTPGAVVMSTPADPAHSPPDGAA
jgi:hypothetical protein